MDGKTSIDGIIGVRYARNCHPDDLWTKYFTSSKYVDKFRKDYGEPDVIEVRQTFDDSLQAREWEHKVLRRLGVTESDRWVNVGTGKSIPSQLGVPKSEEMKIKLLGNQNAKGNHRSKTEKHRKRISNSLRGKIVKEETRRKLSESRKGKSSPRKGKIYERVRCPKCGYECSTGVNYIRWHGEQCRNSMVLQRRSY